MHVCFPCGLVLQAPPLGEGGDVVLPDWGVNCVVVVRGHGVAVEGGVDRARC